MKAVFTVKLKKGYLIVERDTVAITADEIATATVVSEDTYSHRGKVGSIAVNILKPPKAEEFSGD